MKEKYSKKRKVLLIATSVVLVALISIGTTLAYLTAKSSQKDNVFQASGGITLKILEPKFELVRDKINTEPGIPTDKDPMIQNETSTEPIIVGARLSFYINVTGDTYTQVSYAAFSEYVTLNGLPTPASTTGATTFNGSGTWKNVTNSATSNTDGDLFLVYDKVLTPLSGEVGFDEVEDEYTSDGTDNTAPIFTSVTPNATITIMEGGLETTIDGTNVDDTTHVCSGTYGKFNYRIVVNGWGVKASDPTLTGGLASSTDAEKITAAAPLLVQYLD